VRGHGTYVAGAAGMIANNGAGSAGVAWGAKIMPVRVSNADGYVYWSTAAQAINWAADKGARVANLSFNGVSGSSTVKSAADYMRSKGGVVVASAGNTSGLLTYPASDSFLVAAATDSSDNKTSWSSYGEYVDVAAPGLSIYTTANGGSYANVSGTSLSSPITAATVALMMSANPKLSPADVDKIIKSTALDRGTAGWDQYYGHGRIDAAKAVATAKTYAATGTTTSTSTGSTSGSTTTGSTGDSTAPSISIASPTGGSTVSGLVPVDVNYSDNVAVSHVELWVNGTKIITDTTSPFAFTWDTTSLKGGTYSLVAKAYDAAGNVGTSSSVSVTLGNDTTAPVISSFSLTEGMKVASNQKISASATDNQGVAKLSLTIDGKEVATTTGSSISYSWNTRKVAAGSHGVTVRAWDAAGNTTNKSVTVYK
jgi:thermitase